MSTFARVAVNLDAPIHQTFHYHIPRDLERELKPGHLVELQFGRRYAQAIIIAIDSESEVPDTKPVISRVLPEPVIDPVRLRLAEWLTEKYLCTWTEALRLMLPPGLSQRADTVLDLNPEASLEGQRLTANQRKLVNLLQEHGTLRGKQITKLAPELKWQAAAAQLDRRGLIRRASVLDAPRIKPKTVDVVKVTADESKWTEVFPLLGRRTAATQALIVIAGNDNPVSIDEIVSTAGCKPQHVKSLVDRGFAQYTSSDEQLLEKADIDLNHAIAALQKSDKYLAIWEYLRKEEGSALASDLRSSIGCTRKHLSVLEQADIIAIHNVEVWRDPLAGKEFITEQPPKLTDDQAVCWERISLSLSDSEGERKFLLHGVTGSGKTEIYLRAIDQAVKNNKQAIVLVPEIALTPQTVRRFAARFPDRVAILHSRLSAGERFDTWRRARQGDFDVVIGPRSALFAPLERLGVIVIDEEHDEAYKQDPPVRPPYYHAREAAIKLVELCNAVLIMGSATPDVVTYHRAQRGEFGLLELPKRIMGHREWVRREAKRLRIDTSRYQDWDKDTPDALAAEMPPVQMVDMRHELRVGNMSIFSRLLRSELSRVLDSNQQAILFLNRRGTSTYVFCRDCGYVLRCPHCDMPLTYHRPNALLVCHHCGETERQPEKCPVCSSRRVKYFGLGTEGVEQTVINDFPQARILRWDRDTTGKSSAHEEFLLKFVNGEADILIGTQMVAKGLDLPLVTLVGVISADVSLGLPDYRTGERTFQVLAQVAGRAGRGLLGGRAIFQTFNPEHYAVRNASEHDYGGFYAEEMAYRMNLMYPPYRRLARLEYQDPDKHQGRVAGIDLAHSLQRTIDDMMLTSTEIIGPNQPFFHRIGGRYRWQIVIRSPEPTRLLQEVAIPRGWRVDIEPMSLL